MEIGKRRMAKKASKSGALLGIGMGNSLLTNGAFDPIGTTSENA